MSKEYKKVTTCPACGYKIIDDKNVSYKIRELLKVRGKNTVRILNKIATMIRDNIPSDNRYKYYQFLFGIQEIDDNVIEWAINKYYQGRHYYKGKGFAYLRSIAQNRNNNMGVILKNERLMLGTAPPVIEPEKEK